MADPTDDEDDKSAAETERDEELSTKAKVRETLHDLYRDVHKGFEDQSGRSDDNMDYWDIYNCELTGQQFYSGNSQIFVPIVYNAVNARVTRFVNQMFPQSGRYVEVTTENGDQPQGEMALAEHYVRQAKLRTQVMPALVRNGDVEGQYTICLGWQETTRHVAYRKSAPPEMDGQPIPGAEPVDDIVEEEVKSGRPTVEVIADSDFLILPSTADGIDEALEQGGSVTIIRRWGKPKIKQMKKDGHIRSSMADELLEEMRKDETKKDKPKEMVDAAGIKGDGRGKFAQVYETWTRLKIGKEMRLCRAYFAGDNKVLGCKRNPYWSDRCPILSAPAQKIQGSFKGQSRVAPVAGLQYQANDACNEGMDSAAYALLPIIMTDPEKNPRIGSMILSLAAVWETSPNDTQFAKFPDLWKDAFEIVATARTEIFQTLSVNPAQITQAGGAKTKKPSQAEVANEQQVDILTTADAVTIIEDEILTPMVSMFLELDHQFRDKPMLVREYGQMGMRANMQEIEPVQMEKAYQFRWFGVEQARNAQQVQQQIAGINVIRGIPPQQYPGKVLDLGPVLAQLVENTFGPRLAPLMFKDQREEMSVDPMQENGMLLHGFTVPVHASDDHQAHIQAHMPLMQQDPHGTVRVHLMAHMKALEQAQQAAQGAKPPGGGPPGPGGPNQPPPGAQPGQPRGGQNPPGAIHKDQMQDPRMMPR